MPLSSPLTIWSEEEGAEKLKFKEGVFGSEFIDGCEDRKNIKMLSGKDGKGTTSNSLIQFQFQLHLSSTAFPFISLFL